MRLITLLFTLLFWFNAVAVAPYGIKGQSQSGTLYSNVHQFPNNQVTNMGGINALVETGNKNILVNPSFEHSTFSTGWTSGAGSFSQNLTVEIDGLKAAEVTLSAQALSITQDSTLYAAQFADGVQGLASVRVKTSLSGIRVCSRQAGVTSTTNCVNVQGNGKWGLYKVPMILGATSNGISIASNGTSLTGTVYLDDSFVGATDLKVDINNISSWKNGTCSGTWTTNTTYSCKYRQVGTDLEVQYLITLSGVPNAVPLYLNMPSGFTIDTSSLSSILNAASFGDGSARDLSTNVFFRLTAFTASSTTLGLYYNVNAAIPPTGASSSTNLAEISQTLPTIWASGDTLTATIKVPVTQFSNATSVYSSTNADFWGRTYSPTITSDTGALSNFTSTATYGRQGNRLHVKGRITFTGASSAFTCPKIGLPESLTLASSDSEILGDAVFLDSSASRYVKMDTNTLVGLTNSVRISYPVTNTGTNPQSLNYSCPSAADPVAIASGDYFDYSFEVPVNEWQQSNIIIGQFNGLESCTNTLECTDTFSAKISSAGVVSDENVNWINGNCTNSSGLGTCTFNTSIFSVTPNCSVTYDGAGNTFAGRTASVRSASSTQILYITEAGSVVAAPVNIICQKQGADYVGKTARAVANDQNVRTPGATKVVNFSLSYGTTNLSTPCSASPCLIDQVGSVVSSVTRTSTGSYTVNFVNSMDKVHCAYGSGTSSAGDAIISYGLSSCSSSCSNITFSTRQASSVGTLRDSYGSIVCTGVQQ